MNNRTNVSGIIVDSNGETDYSPGALLAFNGKPANNITFAKTE